MTASAILSTTVHKRRRRTKAEIGRMRQVTLDILGGDHPQSVRHIFYRMTDPRLIARSRRPRWATGTFNISRAKCESRASCPTAGSATPPAEATS